MPTGFTRDAGWEIGVSKTLPHSPSAVWEFVTSPQGVGLWLGPDVRLPTAKGEEYRTTEGVTGELRGYRAGERIRLGYGDTVLQVTVSPAAPGKAVLRFHQEHLADAAERERRRTHWRSVMAEVAAALDRAPGA